MPLTEQSLEKYDRLRGRYEEMAERVLSLDPTDPHKRAHRQKVRSAAESYVSPAEAKRRTGDPATLSRIQSQMRHKVTEREGRVASLKGTLSQVQDSERGLKRTDQELKQQAAGRRAAERSTERELRQKAKHLDDEMRKADKSMTLEQSRHQHELAEARKEKMRMLAERRTRQNQAIKQGHREEHELNFKHTKLMQQMEMAQRDEARQERDYESRWRRLEAEKARLKQEVFETKLALEMKAKMRRKQGDEFEHEEEMRRRRDKKMQQEKDERDARLATTHGRMARQNDRGIQSVGMQRLATKERSARAATRAGMSMIEMRNKADHVAEARRAVEENMDFVERQTLLGLADDRDDFAVNKAKLLELEEKFDTFCDTVREKQTWEKSISQQVIEMKKKAHTDAVKHAKQGLDKSATVYKDSLNEVARSTQAAVQQRAICNELEDKLVRLRAQNEEKSRLQRLKQRQEEEKIEQMLLREHSQLTKALCRKAGKETEMTTAAARMSEDAMTMELEEEEMKKLTRIQSAI